MRSAWFSTTSLTIPSSLASLAPTCRPVNIIPMAFFIPICLGSLCIPPAKAANPTLGSGKAKRAFEEAMIKSQANAISIPPPMATPLTAAITGLLRLNLAVRPPNPVSGMPDLSPPAA